MNLKVSFINPRRLDRSFSEGIFKNQERMNGGRKQLLIYFNLQTGINGYRIWLYEANVFTL